MYWGRHVDLLVKTYRDDGTLKYLLRQRKYPWPDPKYVVLEIQDKRTREEARADWTLKKYSSVPEFKHIYANGLPDGWAGVWDQKRPKIAPPLVRRQAQALLHEEDVWIALGGLMSPATARLASFYAEGDTAAFEASYHHQSSLNHYVVLQMGDEEIEHHYLARPVTGPKIEVTFFFTFV